MVLENIKETLETNIISEKTETSADYNLNFVDPLNSEGAKLIDEVISQGLSVEEAIKNANLKLFPDPNIQGPQTLSELKDLQSIEKQTVENKEKDQDNQELNIIEADLRNTDSTLQLRNRKFDKVFHLAAYNHVGDSFLHVNETISSNLLSTTNLLDHGPKFEKFIHF